MAEAQLHALRAAPPPLRRDLIGIPSVPVEHQDLADIFCRETLQYLYSVAGHPS